MSRSPSLRCFTIRCGAVTAGSRRARAPRGFTLIEVLVAMATLLVGMAGSGALIGRTIEKSTSARKTTEGHLVALQTLERLRAEVRVDARTGASCDGSSTDRACAGGGGFAIGKAWTAERLPYSPDDSWPGAEDCNPVGVNDGVTYDVGPLVVRHEGNRYLVCYSLDPTAVTAVGTPPASVDARVKVLWQGPGGWGATWLGTVLLDGV